MASFKPNMPESRIAAAAEQDAKAKKFWNTSYRDSDDDFNTGKLVKQIALGVTALTLLWSSFTTLKETERGIKYRFGKMVSQNKDDLLGPGFNPKWPWISVKKARVDLQHIDIEKMTTNTKDNQVITVENTIFFTTPEEDLVTIYKKNPDWEHKLEKASTDAVKSALGHTEAQNVASMRDSIMDNVTKETKSQIKDLLHIDIDRVLMPNYDFDDDYQKAVSAASNEKAILTGKQTKLLQDSIERQRTIMRTKASADSVKLAAEADAYAITTRKNAEAEGFERIQKVIGHDNMSMYMWSNKWDGKKATYEAGNGGTPFMFNLQPK